MLSIGVPPQDVARRLGHSEPSTTLRIYTNSNLIQDQKIVNLIANNIYNKENNYSFEIKPLTLLAILTNNPKLTNIDNLLDTLEYFIKENITYDELDNYINICKNYLIDINPKLIDFSQTIESLESNTRDKFLDSFSTIFNNNHNLLLEPISDISKYKDKSIKV